MSNRLGNPLAVVLGTGMAVPNSVPIVWPSSTRRHKGQLAESKIDDLILIADAELGSRELKKMDRMAVLAVCAARQAWRNAACAEDERATCGIMSGNAVAGWTFTEPQLRKLYTSGVEDVSPYLASAWFPAASQGQISIHMKLRGYAKTIATDRCAGTQAIGLAAEEIAAGRAARFLAGAAEAPLTPFVERASGSFGTSPIQLAEGAAYLVLGPAVSDRPIVAGIYAHATALLPETTEERLTHCLQLLQDLAPSLCQGSPDVDVLLDSASPSDRKLLNALEREPWVRCAWWVGDYIGNSLAATGPIATAALCGRYAAGRDPEPGIVLSLGTDFASAIVLAAATQEQEVGRVTH